VGCTAHGQCGEHQLCVDGACQACDVCLPVGACAYDTVQAAIDDRDGPSTIHLCPGTYVEDIDIFLREVTLIGAGQGEQETSNTILQGTGTGVGSVVEATKSCSLHRLRVTGGDPFGIDHVDFTSSSTLTMHDCTVMANTGGVNAGIFANLTGCTIRDNHGGGDGGGIRAGVSVTVTLTDCLVTGNEGSTGGGIAMTPYGGQLLILDNTLVSNNIAQTRGGGIYNNSGELRLINGSQVTGNTATFFGGGIYNTGTVLLDASSITGNTATVVNGGGGIRNDDTLTLSASQVTGNLAGGGIVTTGTTNLEDGSEVSGNTGGNCLGTGDYNPDLNPDGSNAFCAA
jgi:predicted outer membrane repeat protein